MSILKHRAKTQISSLNKGRTKLTNENEISKEMVSFFSSLISSDPGINLTNQVELLDVIPSLVSKDHNRLLCAIPKEEDIYKAICSLGGDKSQGKIIFLL